MMKQPAALIVDDEADIRELVEITLTRMGLETESAANLAAGRAKLAERSFDLCLTDMRLPDGNGIDLVREIDRRDPDCPVAVITAYGNTEAAVASLKAGAFDFVCKPVDVNALRRLVKQALKLRDRELPDDDLQHTDQPAADEHRDAEPEAKFTGNAPPRLLGDTPAMRQLRTTIAKLSRSQAPVYISGESGTGKELVARTIHGQGPRAAMPFVPINCGAIPSELMESEFFGHLKGAFTGAGRDKSGLFASADGGTLFLDEIAELPLHMQVKLLRAIQERAVRPVGDQRERSVDVRIISATHKDLAKLVAADQFREDLYYRLNVIEVRVPALRERAADIPELAMHILQELTRQMDLDPLPHLTAEAQTALQQYDYPGNVRELENILERAITLCDNAEITREYLRLESPLAQAIREHPAASAGAIPPMAENGALDESLESLERRKIIDALEQTRYNKTRAAEVLGISFRALRYRLKKLGIE